MNVRMLGGCCELGSHGGKYWTWNQQVERSNKDVRTMLWKNNNFIVTL